MNLSFSENLTRGVHMMNEMEQRKKIRRVFSEKKKGYDVEAKRIYSDLKTNLGISSLKDVRIINRYAIADI